MSTIANNLSTFDSDIDLFFSTCANLRRAYESLGTGMSGMQSMWTGEAHDVLQARFNTDYARLEEVVQFMEQTGQALREASNTYHSCESNIATVIESLAI